MYDQKTIYDAIANVLFRKCGVDPVQAQHVARQVVEQLSSEAVSGLCRGQKGNRWLTSNERDVLDFIIKSTGSNHFAPTVREIADAMTPPVSSTAMQARIVRLTDAGYISHVKRKSRTIRVL